MTDGGMGWALSNAAMAEELHGIEEALDLKQRLLDQMTQGGADIEVFFVVFFITFKPRVE